MLAFPGDAATEQFFRVVDISDFCLYSLKRKTFPKRKRREVMKIRTPHYYKAFKCIAGACTDTCCAGWEVDVDEKAYKYYQSVKGAFGKRLQAVMVPSDEGGCKFTLSENKRCPFLNQKNLCDLYTELGEDKLCDTCAEFPRFINIYGSEKEIGIAPSCKTAGALMLNCKEPLTFDEMEDGQCIQEMNDIDGFLYYQLKHVRTCAFKIIQNETFTPDEACILLLDMTVQIQRMLNHENDNAIAGVVKKYSDAHFLTARLSYCINHILTADKNNETKIYMDTFHSISQFFAVFPNMEIINADWNKYLACQTSFINSCNDFKTYQGYYKAFEEYYKDRYYEYRQLLMYYIYRYFLYAVYDYDVLTEVKNAIVGYEVLKHLDIAAWHKNGGTLEKEEQIDIAHLYSRQFEHSYYNYEIYNELFKKKRCYSVRNLFRLLCCGEWKC